VGFFIEVFGKIGEFGFVAEGCLVFFIAYGELFTCLPHICLVAVWAG
jgi:hypothetical protein